MMGRKFSLHRARPGALQKFVALAVGSVLAFSVHAQPSGLPSMGSASSAELSPALERTLGDAIMEQGRRDPTYINDPDVSQYLAGLGKHLVAASSNPAQHRSEERRVGKECTSRWAGTR